MVEGCESVPAIDQHDIARELADGLTTAGVTLVKGAVVGDATIYDSEETLETWSDEARAQVGPVSALVANNGQWAEGRTSSKAALSAAMLFTDLLRQRGIKVWGEPGSGGPRARWSWPTCDRSHCR